MHKKQLIEKQNPCTKAERLVLTFHKLLWAYGKTMTPYGVIGWERAMFVLRFVLVFCRRTEDVLQLANLPSALRQWRAHWRTGHCEGTE